MAKGVKAKSEVHDRIKKAFGSDYIGEFDKKIFVWGNDEGGQKMQIAIAMTCPKTPVGNVVEEKKEAFDWSDSGNTSAPNTFKPVEIADDEREKVAELMKKLGL